MLIDLIQLSHLSVFPSRVAVAAIQICCFSMVPMNLETTQANRLMAEEEQLGLICHADQFLLGLDALLESGELQSRFVERAPTMQNLNSWSTALAIVGRCRQMTPTWQGF